MVNINSILEKEVDVDDILKGAKIFIKPFLSVKESRDIHEKYPNVTTDGHIDRMDSGIQMALVLITRWNLDDGGGNDRPIDKEHIGKLPQDVVTRVIQTMKPAKDKEEKKKNGLENKKPLTD